MPHGPANKPSNYYSNVLSLASGMILKKYELHQKISKMIQNTAYQTSTTHAQGHLESDVVQSAAADSKKSPQPNSVSGISLRTSCKLINFEKQHN